jgi:Fe-S cluster assembly protein SufB
VRRPAHQHEQPDRYLPGDHGARTGNTTQHEASVSKVSAEQIFYMMQRGLSEGEAMSLAVNGFVNDLIREFPMEYSVELKRLIDLEMEGSVG